MQTDAEAFFLYKFLINYTFAADSQIIKIWKPFCLAIITMNTPLILTVLLDDDAQTFFNQKRKQYFPPERNFLSAHLTLFHHLPDDETTIIETIKTLCGQQKPMTLEVTAPVNIGKGVAYKMESKALVNLHKILRKKWQLFLTPQDRQGLWPHVTVQNKVSVGEAYNCLQNLYKEFAPFTVYANGLILWRYLNGPWQWYRQFLFGG